MAVKCGEEEGVEEKVDPMVMVVVVAGGGEGGDGDGKKRGKDARECEDLRDDGEKFKAQPSRTLCLLLRVCLSKRQILRS